MSNMGQQIYQLLPQVMLELAKTGVGKEQKNQGQGYKFRGIDDLLNSCGPLLAKHGVFVAPWVREVEYVDRGKMTHVRLKMTYALTAPDGSCVEVTTVGEAMDTSDKAANKAMSAALKYALIQTFLIPIVGEEDADFHNPTTEAPPLATKPLEAVDRVELSILQALDKAALEVLVKDIKNGNWTEDEKTRLRAAYNKRVKEVAA